MRIAVLGGGHGCYAAAADMDMLALIFFALVFGAALTVIPRDRAQPDGVARP